MGQLALKGNYCEIGSQSNARGQIICGLSCNIGAIAAGPTATTMVSSLVWLAFNLAAQTRMIVNYLLLNNWRSAL
jgi:hypothetical protein